MRTRIEEVHNLECHAKNKNPKQGRHEKQVLGSSMIKPAEMILSNNSSTLRLTIIFDKTLLHAPPEG